MTEEKPKYDLDNLKREFSALRKYAAMESASQDVIGVKKIYIDMTGDIKAAMVLDELIFWTLPRKNKISGLRVWRDGVLWLAVSRSEWWDRKRLTARQADGAIKKLEDQSIIVKGLFKFNNAPTVHLRLNVSVFFEKYAQALSEIHPPENEGDTLEKDLSDLYEMMGFSISPNGENGNPISPFGDAILPNGDTESPNGENINSTSSPLTQSPLGANAPDLENMPLEWKLAHGQEVTEADLEKSRVEEFANKVVDSAWLICQNNRHLEPLAVAFMQTRGILLSTDKKSQTGHRKALKEMYTNGVKPENITQAIRDLKEKEMTVSDLFSIKKTAIDLANPLEPDSAGKPHEAWRDEEWRNVELG